MKIVVSGVCLASFVLCNCVIALPFKTITYRDAVPKKSTVKSRNAKNDSGHKKDKREYEDDEDQSQDNEDDHGHNRDEDNDDEDDYDHNKDEDGREDDEDDESYAEEIEEARPKADPKKSLEGFYVSLGVGCDMSKSKITTESQEAIPVIKPTATAEDKKAGDEKNKNKGKKAEDGDKKAGDKDKKAENEENEEDEEDKEIKEDLKDDDEEDFIDRYKKFFKNPNENEGWRLKNNYFSVRNGEATFKLSANKKATIADFSKTLPLMSVAVGYGKFLSNESYDNFYLGGEFFVDLGKTGKKEKCFQNWEQEFIRFGEESPSFGMSRPERNPAENYDNCGLSDTLKKSGSSYGFSLRGGYYVKSVAAMIYLKLGMANVKAEVESKTSYDNGTRYFNSTKISKLVPEFMIGMEKIVWRTVSIRAELGYRLNADMHGQLDSQCYLPDPDQERRRYNCKTKIKLETGGRVARVSASWHVP